MAQEVPTYDQLMWPTLMALKAMGGSGTNSEILEKVIELEGYPEEVQNFIHSDNRLTKLNYNLAWAKSYLKNVRAVENSVRGVWAITKKGENLTPEDVSEIPKEVRKKARPGKKEAPDAQGRLDIMDSSPDSDGWKEILLDTVVNLQPDAFERLCQRLLRESGFIKVEVTGRSGDGGIDGIGVLRLALLSFQVFFQCKRYKGSVSAPAVRDFRGAMVGRSDKGLLITTGTFTADARREATRDGAPVIDLIDGEQLVELLKDKELGVRTEQVEQVTVDVEWFSTI